MNKRKKFASVSLAAVLAIGSVAPGFAAVDSYLLQDKNEEVYEYNFDDLKASYQNSVLGVGESVLYDHFKNILDDDGIYFAIEDDVSGYVDYQDVKTAYGNAMLAGESFDVNDYTETEAPSKELPAVIKEINVQDGETVETEKPISAALVVESVSAINATTINAQMATDVDTTKAADETEYTVMVGDTAVEVTAVTFSTVAKIATITVDMNGEEGTLTVNDTAAEDAADYKKPTATVEGFDATHVVVTFSEAVDKTDAENILNYTMSDPSGVVLAAATPLSTDSTASLAEDGMTLTISLGNSDVTGGLVDGSFYLTINDGNPSATADKIKDLAGNVMDKAIIEFAGSATTDTTGPALTSGTYNNATGALKLFFDEAVSTIDGNVAETKITITGSDDATYVLKETDFSGVAGSASSVTVTFGTTAKAAVNALTTPLTVSVEEGAFKDVATNDSLVGSAVLSLTTAPVLQTATYDESTNELVLTFNEEVLYDSLTDLTNIQVKTDTGAFADISASTTVDTTVDGTVLILTPASPTFRTTGTVTSAELKLKAGAVMDVADEQTNVATTVDLTYTDDAAKPVLETVGYSTLSKIFTLTFSEDVDVSTIAAVNFKAYDADTSEATLNNGTTAVITTVDGPTAQIQLDTADAITVAALEQASMKVSVSTVSDMTGNVMVAISETAETGVSVTTTDLTPPQVTGAASVDANTVTVTFDEKLDPTTANVAGNYAIYATDSPATTMSVTNASVNAAGLVVTLTTSTHENAVGYTVDVTGVTDLAGNLVEDGPDATDTFAGSSLANTAPTVASAAYVDVDEDGTVNTGDKVKVTFSEAVTLAGTVNESDFDLTVTTTPSLGTGAVATISETDATIVEIALGASPSLTVTGTKTKIDVKAINDITDLAGKKAVTGTAVVIQGDETAPTISSATYTDVDVSNTMNGNDTITIVYNEDLDVTVANLVDGSNVIDSYAISNFTSYGASTIQVVDSKTIQITFADDADFGTFAVGDNVVYVDASDSVYDLFANEDAVVAKATVGADEVGPKITAADLVDVDGNGVDAGDKLTLTFDQGIQLGSATAANLADDFTLNAGSDLDMANSAAYFVKDQNQLVLTLGTSATITAGPTYSLSLKQWIKVQLLQALLWTQY